MSILKLFFSAKFNLCFIHVVEWAVVKKFVCWIFSCTFGIIFHLDYYSGIQNRFELSESWCMFPLIYLSQQVKFCLTQVVTERNESWKQKMLNIFRPHMKLWCWNFHPKFQISFHWTVRWFYNKFISSENNILAKNLTLVNTDNCIKHFTKPRLLLPKAHGTYWI